MPTHSLPTPADEYQSSVAIHFSNISLLDTKPTSPFRWISELSANNNRLNNSIIA
ncbi:MAG: hypothetical protein JST21_00040 [Bacteroidetes bacterium]|nr:hypothetical protein [Bacteroidota bacterium]